MKRNEYGWIETYSLITERVLCNNKISTFLVNKCLTSMNNC